MQNNIEEDDPVFEERNVHGQNRSLEPKENVVTNVMRSERQNLGALRKKTETEEFKMMRNRHSNKR